MMSSVFLQDLAIVMSVSAVITVLFHRLRIPVVLGYLLTGLLIGPHTPPYPLITNQHDIETLSELGIVFLLFTIGLEFSITKLLRIGPAALIAGLIEVPAMILIGWSLGGAFGWKPMDCLFLGAIVSISSTTIIAKVLVDLKLLQERFAHMILGILIVEDLIAILIIAALASAAVTGQMTWHEAGVSVMQVMTFMVIGIVVTALLVPKILSYIEKLKSQETMTIAVLGMALGGSLLAVRAGFSAALGAFIVGAVIAETHHAHEVIGKMHPLRDMFTAVFFVSVGMQIDPVLAALYWKHILVIALVVIAGKITMCSLGAFLTGSAAPNALRTGLGLAQIGEFSYIIARLGQSLGATSAFLYPVTVCVSAVTSLTTPILMTGSTAVAAFFGRVIPVRVTNFAQFYTKWVGHVGGIRLDSGNRPAIWKGIGRYLPRGLAYAVLGVALYFAAFEIRDRFGLQAGGLFWLAVGIAMFPVLLGLAHTADRIFWNVIFLNVWKVDTHLDPATPAGRGLHNVFRFLMMIVAGMVILALGSLFDPAPPLAVGVVGLIAIAGVLLWKSVRDLHEQVEGAVLGVFDREGGLAVPAAKAAQEQFVQFIREQYPWEVEMLDFLVPYHESALNRSLRELALRSVTGASVVAVYREDISIPNPGPDTRIQPGDVLLLMGDKEQIRKASAYLRGKAVR